MKAIIVFYDSLNRKYLPPYGATDVIAPNFQRLARHSATFDCSYVGSMPCIPARRELHTGRYNFLHREWGPLEPFDDSMPEMLKKAGTYTHLVSDHLHYWEDGGANYHTRYSSWEIVRGQEGDHWIGQVAEPDIPACKHIPKQQTGTGTSGLWRYDWVNRQVIRNEADFPQTQVFNRGCEFIEKNSHSDNWLLHIETFDPHEPFYVPQKYLDMYPEDYQGEHYDWPRGPVAQSEEEINHIRRQYKALVSYCDASLGRILDQMDKHDLWKDTLLIVGTDHGFLLAEHDYWAKNQMPYYNEIANTPLFIWDPRSNVQDVHRQSLVQLIDWAPTLLEYFGQDIPADMQGQSLRPVIESDQPIRDAALFGVFSEHVNVTDGRYVYMRAPLPTHLNHINNYTLMPMHMTKRFSAREMQQAKLVEPFSFTKGCPVLKIPSKNKYGAARFGTLLFDTLQDPFQLQPLDDPDLETRMVQLLKAKMTENDAPPEQFVRLGVY